MQWVPVIIELIKHSKQFVEAVQAFISFLKMQNMLEKSNKEINTELQELTDAVAKRAQKIQAGEPITKEDNEDVKNKARRLYDNFGRIDTRLK